MKPFPWRPRMAATSPDSGFRLTLIVVRDGMALCSFDCGVPGAEHVRSDWYRLETLKPVENDPATLGALLGAVREAMKDPGMHLWRSTDIRTGARGWVVVNDYSGTLGRGATEFEALLAAYEAMV